MQQPVGGSKLCWLPGVEGKQLTDSLALEEAIEILENKNSHHLIPEHNNDKFTDGAHLDARLALADLPFDESCKKQSHTPYLDSFRGKPVKHTVCVCGVHEAFPST